jgi:hypothetical protein
VGECDDGPFSQADELLDLDLHPSLFGLYHDGYMFHQANLRNIDVTPITINGVSEKYSI